MSADARARFLAEVGARPPQRRLPLVGGVLGRVFDTPAVLLGELPPAQVLAAAVLVGRSLPGGAELAGDDPALAAAALPAPATVEVAGLALEAVTIIADRGLIAEPVGATPADRLLTELRAVLIDSLRAAPRGTPSPA
ncbi:hypothetical protein [Micromonospora psammae]|uniref:hypothetical protein n=1 Tax=Micromonospora sp. CPCC 205556 TaxID=3122398 RepID=UPI002FF23B9D